MDTHIYAFVVVVGNVPKWKTIFGNILKFHLPRSSLLLAGNKGKDNFAFATSIILNHISSPLFSLLEMLIAMLEW